LEDLVRDYLVRNATEGVFLRGEEVSDSMAPKGDSSRPVPFLVLCHGEVDVETPEGLCVGTLKVGDTFHEAGLFKGAAVDFPFLLRCTSLACRVLFVHGHVFWDAMSNLHPKDELHKFFSCLAAKRQIARLPLFEGIRPEVMEGIDSHSLCFPLAEGDEFVPGSGNSGEYLCVILRGKAHIVTADGDTGIVLNKGDSFGEANALGLQRDYLGILRAQTDCWIQVFRRCDIVAGFQQSSEAMGKEAANLVWQRLELRQEAFMQNLKRLGKLKAKKSPRAPRTPRVHPFRYTFTSASGTFRTDQMNHPWPQTASPALSTARSTKGDSWYLPQLPSAVVKPHFGYA
jgi:signal-transduction protein with cAMP-binding, CBS, and nucleotidyltransferase domain